MKGQRLTLLRAYLDDGERGSDGRHPLGVELVEAAFDERIAGATVLRGAIGIGRSRRVRRIGNEADLDHLPLIVQLADTDARIDAFCDAHAALLGERLTTRATIWFVHRAGDRALPEPVEDVPTGSGHHCFVRMFCNYDDVTEAGDDAVSAVTRAVATHSVFHMATTGVEGFGSHRVLHRAHLFHRDRSMPVMITVLCGSSELDAVVRAATDAFSRLTITVEIVDWVALA